jgi:hypothetical protein
MMVWKTFAIVIFLSGFLVISILFNAKTPKVNPGFLLFLVDFPQVKTN